MNIELYKQGTRLVIVIDGADATVSDIVSGLVQNAIDKNGTTGKVTDIKDLLPPEAEEKDVEDFMPKPTSPEPEKPAKVEKKPEQKKPETKAEEKKSVPKKSAQRQELESLWAESTQEVRDDVQANFGFESIEEVDEADIPDIIESLL